MALIDSKYRELVNSVHHHDLQKFKQILCQSDYHPRLCVYSKTKDTLIHVIAQLGFVEFLEFIASQFPEDIKELFECKNVDGKTPLHEAAQFSQTDIITFLLVHNVQVDPIKKADWTPLMLACTKTGKESQKSINMLISKGADLMLQNKVLIYYLCYSHSFYEILIFFLIPYNIYKY